MYIYISNHTLYYYKCIQVNKYTYYGNKQCITLHTGANRLFIINAFFAISILNAK